MNRGKCAIKHCAHASFMNNDYKGKDKCMLWRMLLPGISDDLQFKHHLSFETKKYENNSVL